MNQRNPAISKGIDWSLVWIYLLLVAIGITAVFGATYKEGDAIVQSFIAFKTDYSKQLYFFVAALLRDFFWPLAWRFDFVGGFVASADAAAGSVGFVFALSRSARNAVEDSTDLRPCR